jgi:hypothetical protein
MMCGGSPHPTLLSAVTARRRVSVVQTGDLGKVSGLAAEGGFFPLGFLACVFFGGRMRTYAWCYCCDLELWNMQKRRLLFLRKTGMGYSGQGRAGLASIS